MAEKKGQGGFTMVELLVTVLTGSMIMFAALTIILLGIRVQKQSSEAVRQQNTARVVLEMLEDLATEGTIKKVSMGAIKVGPEENTETISADDDSWAIWGDETDDLLLWYNPTEKTISGRSGVILNNVIASHVMMSGKLLTFAVETPNGSYTSSVYCRTSIAAPGAGIADELIAQLIEDTIPEGSPLEDVSDARLAFLKALAKEYKTEGVPNTGIIQNGGHAGQYYTQWYLGGTYTGDWNKDTPWCACFVSWALVEAGQVGGNNGRWYANVDQFWSEIPKINEQQPKPGDIIFFDWIVDETADPQHVGVVLAVTGDKVYTIEGNSAGMVALCSYPVDSDEILGYGQISWNDNP